VQPVMPLSLAEIDGADGVEDLGEIPFPPEAGTPPAGGPPAAESPGPPAPDPGADEGPGHARKDWRKQHQARVGPTQSGRARAVRVTVSIRADISAKVSMPLAIAGSIWEARDPLCGGTFVRQRPDIADALTDIICDSADLVAFFTGPGGAFMKYLNLGAALWPVIEVAAAHHVYHSVALDGAESDAGAPAGRYAA
jgi:hypothetical protein